jgi:hypothetical protein
MCLSNLDRVHEVHRVHGIQFDVQGARFPYSPYFIVVVIDRMKSTSHDAAFRVCRSRLGQYLDGYVHHKT